jgi:molybdopterin converting factor small subunit
MKMTGHQVLKNAVPPKSFGVTVVWFGRAREFAGTNEEELELPDHTVATELIFKLRIYDAKLDEIKQLI